MNEQIKSHFMRHKKVYLIGSCVAVAGITYIIMRGRIEALALRGACGPETADTLVTNRPLFSLFSGQNSVVIRQELGRPPYLIWDKTTDLYYRSQSRIAQVLGVSNSTVSQHLNGKSAHVAGHILERVFVD